LQGEKVCVSYGIINNINNYDLYHLCSTDNGSSGSPILNINNNKIIGIHREGSINFNFNKGTFIKHPINDFISKNIFNIIINENTSINNNQSFSKDYNNDYIYQNTSINNNKLYSTYNNFNQNNSINNSELFPIDYNNDNQIEIDDKNIKYKNNINIKNNILSDFESQESIVKKESDKIIEENSIMFQKYKFISKLKKGQFIEIYKGKSIKNNELVVIKLEKRSSSPPLLEKESFFLYTLKGIGIPEILSYGIWKKYNALVEPLLGKSLYDIFIEKRNFLPIEDICLIAIQIIERIQWVHSKNIIHRDIKPNNFLIGRKDPNIIYLIDFGLSKKYKSSSTGKHVKFHFTGKLIGNLRFASVNALRGAEQSRRDDLESIGYLIIYFMKGKLPWQIMKGSNKEDKYLKIYNIKNNISPEILCNSLPYEIIEYIKYVKKLDFEQLPDYNYLRGLFKTILKRLGYGEDIFFSWIRNSDLIYLKTPRSYFKKDNPQRRLFRNIENNLKNKINNSKKKNYMNRCSNKIPSVKNDNNSEMDDIISPKKKFYSKDELCSLYTY